MKPLTALFMILLIAALACISPTEVPPQPQEESIGNIVMIHTRVQSGRSGNITDVNGSRDFYNEESVRVRDQGKGRINFNDGSQITLYNNTSTDEVVANVSPPEVKLLLTEQGFQGYVPHGNSFTVNMPNGAQVKILGTQFFVVYDPGTNFSIAGNFDGTVIFTPPGGSEQPLPPHTMVDIAPDGSVSFIELPYDPANFEEAADRFGSPMEGVRALRDEYSQPQPGWIVTEEPVLTEPPPTMPSTVFRTLLRNEGSFYSTDMAESYSVETSSAYVEFVLRPGLFLSDGTPFTTSVLRSILEEKWEYAAAGRVSFELIDDYTIWFFPTETSDITFILDEMSKFTFEMLP